MNVTGLWHVSVISLTFKMGHVRDYLSSKSKIVFWKNCKCAIPTYIYFRKTV